MYKETIKFEDIEGNEVEREFYFRLTKMELVEILAAYEVQGGFLEVLAEATRKNRVGPMLDLMHMVIIKSYGVPSESKLGLIKDEALIKEFVGSEAYDQFFLSMVNDQEKFSKFFLAISPKEAREDLEKAFKEEVPKNTKQAYETIQQMKVGLEVVDSEGDKKK